MLLLLVAGLFCICVPSWIICASGMGELEDEPAILWLVRVLGILLVGIPLYFTFVRH
jgi:hypothetical protein